MAATTAATTAQIMDMRETERALQRERGKGEEGESEVSMLCNCGLGGMRGENIKCTTLQNLQSEKVKVQ